MAFAGQKQRTLAILLLSLSLAVGISQVWSRKLIINDDEASMEERHEQWMREYGKVYKDEEEKQKRFLIFKQNVEYIESFNAAGDNSYKLGINHLTDLTVEDLKGSLNGYKRPQRGSTPTPFKYANVESVPASIDWRTKGAVTSVKNQGFCGSCWAFSAVAAVEGIHAITSGELVSLSEQEVVSCDINGRDMGCYGGYMEGAFEYIWNNGGINSDSNYPYNGTDATCNETAEAFKVASIKGYEMVPANNESEVMKALANQPLSVAISASSFHFQGYSGGVFDYAHCGYQLDHGVTAVGYGTTENGTDYWIVKNSWGENWGEGGYIRMKRGIGAGLGLCGIAMDASYPTA